MTLLSGWSCRVVHIRRQKHRATVWESRTFSRFSRAGGAAWVHFSQRQHPSDSATATGRHALQSLSFSTSSGFRFVTVAFYVFALTSRT